MESLSLNSALSNLIFKTTIDNQEATLGYSDLFDKKRVVIFSLPTMLTNFGWEQLLAFDQEYQLLKELGIDQVCCVNSNLESRLLAYYSNKFSRTAIPLPDLDQRFMTVVTDHFEVDKDKNVLARFWQYIVIINNGVPEKLFQNPIKSDISLRIAKNKNYQYRNLGPQPVLKYLTSQQEISKM
jgi:peroxiredoxin